ncbi:tRNA (adenosine(37)-N6)-threonylcarbamoyltransferase complex ATPase subunit type 1 TsaE [Trichothermofontia sp.]
MPFSVWLVLSLLVTYLLPTAADTRSLGEFLGRSLAAGSVLFLQGDLGSGKTTLVQGLGAGLGITEVIDSPTFTLINEYLGGRLPLYHFDLYRLQLADTATLAPEQYWEGVETEPGIVAIEWPERLPYPPKTYLKIQLQVDSDQSRTATLTPVGNFILPPLIERVPSRNQSLRLMSERHSQPS